MLTASACLSVCPERETHSYVSEMDQNTERTLSVFHVRTSAAVPNICRNMFIIEILLSDVTCVNAINDYRLIDLLDR